MRRLVPLVLTGLLLLAACGTDRPTAGPSVDPSVRPTPTATAKVTHHPKPSQPTVRTPAKSAPAPDLNGPLASFPLALGYDVENGDDGTPVVVTAKPAIGAFSTCDVPTWDPHAGTTDVIGVEFRGEAEWSRGRTLVLYPSDDAASAALDSAHEALAACPEETGDHNGNAAHTLIDLEGGDQSVGWIDRWHSADLGGRFDTGLAVYHLVRVGRAVLASYEYGEGNGSDETRSKAISLAARADQPVVDRMADLPSR